MNLHRSAVYAFVLLLSNTAMHIGVARAIVRNSWGSTEAETASAVVVKSDKKAKNSQQDPEPTPTFTPTPTPTRYLVVETGRDCSIEPPEQASGHYTLRATIGSETVLFSERPVRTAGTMGTQEFVNRFKKLFAASNPNTAITFTGDDRKVRCGNIQGFTDPEPQATGNNNNTGPLIVVLSRPKIAGTSSDGSTVMIEYTMTQSASQGEVASIEQFLEMSGSCSIFIDSLHVAGAAALVLE